MKYAWFSILALGLFSAAVIGRAWSNSTPASTPTPPLAQLRYDARQICVASWQYEREAAEQAEEVRRFLTSPDSAADDLAPYQAEWLRRVETYIDDQKALESSRHITAPNYQDMANAVCPQ